MLVAGCCSVFYEKKYSFNIIMFYQKKIFLGCFVILFTLHQLTSSEIDISDISVADFKNNKEKERVSRVKLEVNGEDYDLPLNNPNVEVSTANNDAFDSNDEKPLFSGHRIVHLDLKGAPPKVSYFVQFFPLIKMLGATGILIEYEDMFPYSGIEVSANNAYSKEDIGTILKLSKENELEVIPLIQTFGHLEFVLKLEQYKDLREIGKYPQVVCPSKNETILLLETMVDEILSMHPDAKYIHIGCDEVYHLGKCYSCIQTIMQNRWSKQQLFLNHVTTLARYIRDKYPAVTTLTWDDQFRKISLQELTDSGIGYLVEPVVWKYTPNIDTYLPDTLWDKYATVFKNVWIATAFKGATGPNKYVTDISYHLANHKAWMKLIDKHCDKMNFKGIFLTGWQRYDHFSVLCELLPAGIPSLATNLVYITSDITGINEISNKVGSKLECGPGFLKNSIGAYCGFPGAGVYEAAIKLNTLSGQIQRAIGSDVAKGWFSDYNIEIGISNPSHVEQATFELDRFTFDLINLQEDIIKFMDEIYNSDTVREWIDSNIKPLMKILNTLSDARRKLLQKYVWPRRPFSSEDV